MKASKTHRRASPPRFPTLLPAVVLSLVTVAAYLPALHGDFVWDDGDYITENPHIRHLDFPMLKWACTKAYAANWHPLTWLSHAVDVAAFGYNPFGHHAVNVALHALNAALLFTLLFRMTDRPRRSLAVAALFALHPIHVESVAWIAERKDVLSTFFFLLTIHAYVTYVQCPRWTRYAPVVLAFAAGLASKPMLVTLPFVLLLFDYWPLHRLNAKTILEKIPLFALTVASAVVTASAQASRGAMTASSVLAFSTKAQNAVICYVRYIAKTLFPDDLSPYYPYPGITADPYPPWAAPGSVILLLMLTAFAVWQARSRRYLAVGWFFYLGTLVPVIGLVQVGRQPLADRYTYIPLIGLFLAAVWLVGDALDRWRHRTATSRSARAPSAATFTPPNLVTPCSVALFALLALLTWRQTGVWSNSEVLWRRVLRTAPRSPIPHFNLGNALFKQDALSDAAREYRIAIELDDPEGQARAHAQLALVFKKQGDLRGALDEFRRAIDLAPRNARIRGNYANTLFQAARIAEADETYRIAVGLDGPPQDVAKVHRNYAVLLLRQGRIREGIEHCREALALAPNAANFEALAYAFVQAGKPKDALSTLQAGLRALPADPRLSARLAQLQSAASNKQ